MSSNEEMVFRRTLSGNNDNFRLESRIIVTPEITKRDFQIKFCMRGHFLANDAKPIDGYAYKLINKEYIKQYSKYVKRFPINVLKTQTALNEMLLVPKLLDLFKCMDRGCTETFTQKDLFKEHIKLHYESQTNNTDYFKLCAYCYKKFKHGHNLAEHVAKHHSYCKYFCPYCFYRAYTPTHVLVHIDQTHANVQCKVITFEYDENRNNSRMEIPMAVDFSKFVLPLVCNVWRCKFSCYSSDYFTTHLLQEHNPRGQFGCYLCEEKNDTSLAFYPDNMADHLKIHGINKYQCVFCLFGSGSTYSMVIHLSMEHFEFNPICLERVIWDGSAYKHDLNNLKITRLTLPIDNGVLDTICSSPENSSLSDTLSQAPNRIVEPILDSAQITDGMNATSVISSEFIDVEEMNDVNDKKMIKVALSSGSGGSTVRPESSDNDSIVVVDVENDDDSSVTIIVDDDEDHLNEGNTRLPGKRKRSVHESSNESNVKTRLAWPIVTLDSLFDCEVCGVNFQDSQGYLDHLYRCTNMPLSGRQCPFCPKSYKTNFFFTEHIKLHGPNRFSCSYCGLREPSKRAIEHHMRVAHDAKTFEYVPLVSGLNDPEKDKFIVHQRLNNSTNRFSYSCCLCEFAGHNYRNISLHMKNTHTLNKWQFNVLCDTSSSNINTQHYIVKLRDNNSSPPEL